MMKPGKTNSQLPMPDMDKLVLMQHDSATELGQRCNSVNLTIPICKTPAMQPSVQRQQPESWNGAGKHEQNGYHDEIYHGHALIQSGEKSPPSTFRQESDNHENARRKPHLISHSPLQNSVFRRKAWVQRKSEMKKSRYPLSEFKIQSATKHKNSPSYDDGISRCMHPGITPPETALFGIFISWRSLAFKSSTKTRLREENSNAASVLTLKKPITTHRYHLENHSQMEKLWLVYSYWRAEDFLSPKRRDSKQPTVYLC